MGVNQNAKKGIEYYQSLLPANAKNNSNNSTKKDLSYYQSLLSKANTVETAPTSAVSLQSSAVNKSEKPTNPSDLLKRVTVVDNRKLSTALRADELEKQIKQKESEYVKAANMSDWPQSIKERERISKELSAMQDELKSKRAELRDPSQDKLLTAQQVKENQKNAPLTDKIESTLHNLPRIAESTVRTAADIYGSAVSGGANAVEGIADMVVGNAGTVLSGLTSGFGLKPNNVSEGIKRGAENFIKKEIGFQELTDQVKNEGSGAYEPKVLGVKVRDIANNITDMLVSAKLGGVYGFIGSAGGKGIEQALNEGQSLNRATAYGDISGVLEGVTEKLFDAVKLVGGGKLDKFIPKGAISKLVGGAAGEGIEEMISEGLNPLIRGLTYEKGTYDYPTAQEWLSNVGQAAWQGFVVGLILKGGQDVSDASARAQYKNEVANAVEKVKGLTQQQKETVKQELSKAPEQGNVSLLANVNENQKNDVSNAPQTQNMQQPNVTLPTQAQMAQKANMEQINKNTTNNPRLQLSSTVSDVSNNNIGQNINDVNISKTNDTQKFSEQVEAWKENRINKNNELVVLEKTPQILLDLGLDDYPITLKPTKLNALYNETTNDGKNPHNLGELVKEIPEALKRPLNIVQSVTDPDSIVVVTDLADKNGDIVIVSLKPNTKGQLEIEGISKNENVNKLTSAYGKNSYDYIKDKETGRYKDGWMELNRKNDKILYDIDEGIIKKRINGQWLQSPNVAKTLSNNIIPDNDTNINTQYAPNISNDTADTQSAFSMPENYISPAEDIQKASDFINTATVNDIDTLNKMVEEAEKYPDRVDLQFFAEKAREVIEKLSRQQVRQTILDETGLESYNLDDVNKVSKFRMNITTPVRVIEKVFGKETADKINENFFKTIKHSEAERIRRLNKERAEIKELDIKPGTAEDAAIQKYGEGEYVDENGLTIPYTLENLKRDFPESWQKLQKATNVIRGKYDTYLEEINKVLVDNGYDPIPKRKDYFRHFEELNDLFSVIGVPTKVDDIPTDLNGATADLKPGKNFFVNALQRKGNKTTYSAIKGIDGYLDGAMNILYHTRDIQKLRTLDKYIRDTYGQTKGLANVDTMTDEQKAKRINQINEGHLSEFAAWLTEYTNALAGKKSRLDRGMEEMFGRRIYKTLNLIKKQVGANMTGLNVNTALSNFISLTQAAPKTNKKAFFKGTVEAVKNIFNNDGFVDKSDFLTTRFGSDKIAKNWWQKASDAGQIFMSGTDYFTANVIVRSKYQEFLDKGYSETEAIRKADEFADRLMAGRGKGDLPNAFESKMLGIVTQFQLEVTNQLDSMFYDTFQENYATESKFKLAKEHPKFYNTMAGTFILGQIFALAFLFNEGKEEVMGTEGGAFDPIGIVLDAIKYYTNDDLKFWEATAKVVEDIANQLPFASIVTGGGRIPIKEAFPDLLSVMKGESKLGDELWNLTNLLLPTGGGQVKKTIQGIDTFAKGGSYSKDAEGNKKLKYPVAQTPANLVKSALFGKWATEGAKDYIDRGFKSLSTTQTEAYEKAIKAGISSDDFYKAYNAQKGIESDKDKDGKTITNSKSLKKKQAIDEATKGLNANQKKILYDAFNISKTVQEGKMLPTQKEQRAKLPPLKK